MALTGTLAICGFDCIGVIPTLSSNASQAAGFSVSNAANHRLHSVAQWASVSGVQLTADWGATRSFGFLAAIGHNLQADATVQALVSANSDLSSPVLDVTGDAANVTVATLQPVRWRQPHGWVWLHLPAAAVSGRYSRLVMTDADNPDGGLRVAVLIGGEIYQFPAQFDDDWEQGDEQLAVRNRESSPMVQLRRTHRFGLRFIPKADMLKLQDLFRSVGTVGRLLYVPRPADADTWLSNVVWGHLASMPKWRPMPKLSGWDTWQTDLEVVEALE